METNEASAAGLVTNQLLDAAGSTVMSLSGADVGRNREEQRRRRLWRLATFAGLPAALLWWRIVAGHPMNFFQLPHIDPMIAFIVAMIVVLLLATVAPFLFFGRSPHVMYRPEQLDIRPRRRRRHRHRQRRGRPLAQPVPRAQDVRRHDGRHAAPRPAVRGRARHRQDLHREGDGGRGRCAVPVRLRDLVPVDDATARPR